MKRAKFSYRGDGTGKIQFYRGEVAFSWPAADIDRESARAFVERLNGLNVRNAERLRKAAAGKFYVKHYTTGPAEPRNAKEKT